MIEEYKGALLYLLQLKSNEGRRKYFTHMEPNPFTNVDYMEVDKWMYAEIFNSLEEAEKFRRENDKDGLFEVELYPWARHAKSGD